MITTLQQLLQEATSLQGSRASVARKTGISTQRLAALTTGDVSGWTTSMVESLTRAAQRDPAAVWALKEAPARLELSFLRGLWADFHPDDLPILHRILEQAATLRALQQILSVPSAARPEPHAVIGPPFEDGYRAAQTLRAALQLPDAPLPNLHRLVPERLGVLIAHRHLRSARLNAAALFSTSAEAIVINNPVESSYLLHRRSIAHELSHILLDLHRHTVNAVLEGSADREPEEQRARAFAAELLLPLAGLQQLLGAPRKRIQVPAAVSLTKRAAQHFSAPTELVTNHLANRGYIAKSIRARVISETRWTDVRTPEQRISVWPAYLEAATRDLLISPGRAAELRSILKGAA